MLPRSPPATAWLGLFYFFMMLGREPRAFHILGKHGVTELCLKSHKEFYMRLVWGMSHPWLNWENITLLFLLLAPSLSVSLTNTLISI